MLNPAVMVPILVGMTLVALMLHSIVSLRVPARNTIRAYPGGGLIVKNAMTRSDHSAMKAAISFSMTAQRSPQLNDAERAVDIVNRTRLAIEKYADYKIALIDGYRMYPPPANSSSHYQFTNSWYGFKSAFEFDPEHPTSLLYERTAAGGYRLIGAVLTAPVRFTEEQLDERVPVSIAHWERDRNLGWMVKLYPFEGDAWSEAA